MELIRRLLTLSVVRFVLVGVVNTGFSFGIYLLCVHLGMPFALASLVSIVLGIGFSFKTQGALVFSNRDGRLFGRFVAVWAVIYLFNIGVIYVLVQLGLSASWAGAVAIAPTTVASFLAQRFFTFGRPAVRPAPHTSRE